MGVPRHDAEARRIAVLRNWEFFRAPMTAIVCMHRAQDQHSSSKSAESRAHRVAGWDRPSHMRAPGSFVEPGEQ